MSTLGKYYLLTQGVFQRPAEAAVIDRISESRIQVTA